MIWGDNLLFIDGANTEATDGSALTITSPATNKELATVASAGPDDVARAVHAARSAFENPAWSGMQGAERGRLLFKLADLVERDAELLARYDALAIGRPLNEATLLDVPNAIATLRYYAGWADKLEGRVVPTGGYMGKHTLSYVTRVPIGVIAMITPWNAPLMILCWKLGPALATGCTAVIKPAEQTPLSALHLASLAREAGFPDGVINVIPGTGAIAGDALARHASVDKISFTGSPQTGAHLMRIAADSFKRIALELGGKSPQILFDDCDIDAAVQGCAMGLFFNQGQVCAAGTRIIVQRGIVDRFTAALTAAAESIRVGDPTSSEVEMGSLASRTQFNLVHDYVVSGKAEGAKMLTGGPVSNDGEHNSCFYRPTLFGDVTSDMRIAQEEIFGPVGCILPFEVEEEAVKYGNGTRYGLAATIWTRDLGRAHRVAAQMRAGAVSVNGWATIDPALPWGGFKTSGIGRELGKSGLDSCTEEKVTTIVL